MKNKIVTGTLCSLLGLVCAWSAGRSAQDVPKKSEGRELIKGLADKFVKQSRKAKSADEMVEALALISDAADELRSNIDIAAEIERRILSADPNLRRQTLLAMGKLGGALAPSFLISATKSLDDSDEGVQLAAVQALFELLPHKPAMPKLAALSKHRTPMVRYRAVACLGRYARFFKDPVPALTEALDDVTQIDKYNTVRSMALDGLRGAGMDAKEAAPRIVKLIESEKRHEDKRRALVALTQVAPGEPVLVTTLKQWMKSPYSEQERAEAVGLVAELGQNAKSLVRDLVAVLKDTEIKDRHKDLSLRRAVVSTLARIGPIAKEALPTLESLRATNDRDLSEDVIRAIEAIRGKKQCSQASAKAQHTKKGQNNHGYLLSSTDR